MKKIRLAINGFGRIGRHVFRVALENKKIEIVAVNDLTDNKTLAHLLKYDTAYPTLPYKISHDEKNIIVGRKKIKALSERDPKKLPWKKLKIDVVIESTGVFRTKELSSLHLKAGAKRVIISAPSKGGGVNTFVRGVNSENYKTDKVIDMGSCTTNCTAPVVSIIDSAFGIEKAMLTTVHSYTADQNLQDGPHRDLRRARAAAQNMIPTTTGAAKATTKVIPSLQNKFDGIAVRVPTISVSLTDFTFVLSRDVTVEEVNRELAKASRQKHWQGVFTVTDEPLVSSDFIRDSHSSTADLGMTRVVDGNLVKVVAWYDNEWGYASRLVEMVSGWM